jgi:hypothetical protein
MITGWVLVRCLITLVYVAAVGLSFARFLEGKGMPFPFAAAAYTAAYGILMTLLWLYEKYPPGQ